MATDLEQLRVQMTAETRRYEANMRAAANETNRTLSRIERRFAQNNRNVSRTIAATGRTLRTAFAGVLGGILAREAIQAGDAWTRFGNQLNAVAVQLGRPVASLDQLVEVAMRSRSSLESTVTLYTRLERAGQALGRTQEQMLAITETVNQAFAVGGASASEQAAAVTQLSQAIASGRLAGDELRSITENAPMIAQAIADAMGVGIGELRDLGAEGRITADIILNALQGASQGIEGQFSTMGLTVSQAMTNLRTAALQAVGGADQATGATSALAEAIDDLAETIRENRGGIESFFANIARGAGFVIDALNDSPAERAAVLQDAANQASLGQLSRFDAVGFLDRAFPGATGAEADRLNRAMEDVQRIFREMSYLDQPGVLDPRGVEELTLLYARLAREVRGVTRAASPAAGDTGADAPAGNGSGSGSGVASPAAGIIEAEGKNAEQIIKNATTELEAILQAADEALATVRDEAGEEKQRLADDMVQAFQQRREEMRETFRYSFTSGVSAALLEGEDGLRRWFANAAERGLEQALNRLADQLFDIFSQSGGGKGGGFFSSIIGNLFGGGKAYGGPVQAGMSYTVGERGPERFVPSSPGVIIPRGVEGGSTIVRERLVVVSVDKSAYFTTAVREQAAPIAQAAARAETGVLRAQTPAIMEAVLPGALRKAQNDGRL